MMHTVESSPPPVFNTLKVEILNNDKFQQCLPNARQPIPFETEVFKGVCFIVVRTDPYDTPYQHFFIGRRRLFEVQVQGKFQRYPIGELYVGAEAGNKLELGLITKSIARAAIQLASAMASNLHSSLGDMKGKDLYQLPHVVAPLFTTFDKIIVTPEGEIPPSLGTPFIEDLEYRKQRLKFHKIKDANINLTNTYSFSVNTSNINLISWTLCGIPMVRPMDLRIFLADSPIRLVGYEIPDSITSGPNKTIDHPVKELNYVFNMMLSSIVPQTEIEVDLPTADQQSGSDDEGEDIELIDDTENDYENDNENVNEAVEAVVPVDESALDPVPSRSIDYVDGDEYQSSNDQSDDDGDEDGDGDRDEDFNSKINKSSNSTTPSSSNKRQQNKLGFRNWIKKRMSVTQPPSTHHHGDTLSSSSSSSSSSSTSKQILQSTDEQQHQQHSEVLLEATESSSSSSSSSDDYVQIDYEMEARGDLRFCPCSVETFKEGYRRIYYFIPTPTPTPVSLSPPIPVSSSLSIPVSSSLSIPVSSSPIPVSSLSIPVSSLSIQVSSSLSIPVSSSPPIPVSSSPPIPVSSISIPVSESGESSTNTDTSNVINDNHVINPTTFPKLRPYSEIMKVLPSISIPRLYKNRRLSSIEKRRRQIVESYHQALKQENQNVLEKLSISLHSIVNSDKEFLDGNASVSEILFHRLQAFQGSVALASSRRHWIEYSLILSKKEACFYRQKRVNKSSSSSSSSSSSANTATTAATSTIKTARRPDIRIKMYDVVSIQPMSFYDIPIEGFSFLEIETFSRVYYIMLRSDIQLNEWIQAFVHFRGREVLVSMYADVPLDGIIDTHSPTNKMKTVYQAEIEGSAYLAKSGCWNLDKKRIFNYRRISFNPTINSSFTSLKSMMIYKSMSPNSFIESVLSNILYISQPEINTVTPSHWVHFMDKISWLQTMNISSLNEIEKTAFFLNLYHIMVIHGSLVIGSPPAWNHWNAFFNNICYLFSYEIISISDIEHNILRAAMCRPSSLSIIPVPYNRFPGLAITQRDFRLNFCINNGSKSMPSMIPIYSPDNLDEYLDEMTKLMLLKNTEIDQQKKTIILPKALLHDFIHGSHHHHQNNNSNNNNSSSSVSSNSSNTSTSQSKECLRVLTSYLSKDDRDFILKIVNDNLHVTIKFKNHNLRCRKLCLYNPSTATYIAYLDKLGKRSNDPVLIDESDMIQIQQQQQQEEEQHQDQLQQHT